MDISTLYRAIGCCVIRTKPGNAAIGTNGKMVAGSGWKGIGIGYSGRVEMLNDEADFYEPKVLC